MMKRFSYNKLWILVLFMFLSIITKTSANSPDTLWTKIMGDERNDKGSCIIQTADSNYAIAGSRYSMTERTTLVWFLILSPDGDLLLEKDYGVGRGISIIQNNNKEFVLLADSNNKIRLIKIDKASNILWDKDYGKKKYNSGTDIQTTNDNLIIVSAFTYDNYNEANYWLIKANQEGDTVWTKSYSKGTGGYLNSVKQTVNNGFILAGNINNPDRDHSDVWIIKTNSLGDTIWTKTFGSLNSDFGEDIIVTDDNHYIITGSYNEKQYSSYTVSQFWLFKINSIGDLIWTKTYGDTFSLNFSKAISRAKDSGFIITGSYGGLGSNGGGFRTFKTDSNGELQWQYTIADNSGSDIGMSVIQDFEGNYVITGIKSSVNNDSYGDLIAFKLENDMIKADFKQKLSRSFIPFKAEFSDSSKGAITSWQWDFENDGIVDSYVQNPTHTYLNANTYSVKLIASNGFTSDTLLKEHCITAYFDTINPALNNSMN